MHRDLKPQNIFLSDGLAEAITRGLSGLDRLRVVGWSTSAHHRNSQEGPAAIGRALDVDAMLTGRVAEHDHRLVVSAELVDTASGDHL